MKILIINDNRVLLVATKYNINERWIRIFEVKKGRLRKTREYNGWGVLSVANYDEKYYIIAYKQDKKSYNIAVETIDWIK